MMNRFLLRINLLSGSILSILLRGGEHSGITINRRIKGLILKGEHSEIETNPRCQGFLCLNRKK
jgi:hypothetical protein